MKRNFFYIMATAAVFFTACTVEGTYTGEKPDPKPANPEPMILTIKGTGEKTIELAGSGTASIDWGGSVDELALSSSVRSVKHTYTSGTEQTVKITGENITTLDCKRIQLSGLDVSKNSGLKVLNCSFNLLESLNVDKNTNLTNLWCYNNNITALKVNGLNALKALDVSTKRLGG